MAGSSSGLVWLVPSFTTLSLLITLILRTRRRGIAKKHPTALLMSPKNHNSNPRELSDNIVAIESSDKGALIPHPRRKLKNDLFGFSTMQRKVLLVMVGKEAGQGLGLEQHRRGVYRYTEIGDSEEWRRGQGGRVMRSLG